MMTVFSEVVSAPVEDDAESTREDILLFSRMFREHRVAKFRAQELAEFRRTA